MEKSAKYFHRNKKIVKHSIDSSIIEVTIQAMKDPKKRMRENEEKVTSIKMEKKRYIE